MSDRLTQVLDVRGLRVVRVADSADIVSDVDLSLDQGEILGLVGESGSGKTTVGLAILNHCRSGLRISPNSRVIVRGTSILDFKGQRLQVLRNTQVTYVPQDPGTALNPALRIRTHLADCLPASSQETRTALVQLLQDVESRRRRMSSLIAFLTNCLVASSNVLQSPWLSLFDLKSLLWTNPQPDLMFQRSLTCSLWLGRCVNSMVRPSFTSHMILPSLPS